MRNWPGELTFGAATFKLESRPCVTASGIYYWYVRDGFIFRIVDMRPGFGGPCYDLVAELVDGSGKEKLCGLTHNEVASFVAP
jgi:hypothetical protein